MDLTIYAEIVMLFFHLTIALTSTNNLPVHTTAPVLGRTELNKQLESCVADLILGQQTG